MGASIGTKTDCWIHWNPGTYLPIQNETETSAGDYAIVVLNRPITVPHFAQLWNEAKIRCIVDGGMNRFLNWKQQNPDENISDPHLFSGDFDSCKSESMEYAKKSGCEIIKTPDQNETDFTKALKALTPHIAEQRLKTILAVCDTSGRFDQIMANINTMFKMQKLVPDVDVMLMSRNSIAFLLSRGSHIIHIPRYVVDAKLWCALVPLVCTTKATTTGLKWNLNNSDMEFGGVVSTSNTYKKDSTEVTVVNDNTLLWIMGIAAGDD